MGGGAGMLSMTGYGSAKGAAEDLEITVEVKSVNNRYLDTSVRMPRSFLFAEEAVKSAVQRHISRGKVDVFVSVDASAADNMTVKINEPLLRGYLEAIRYISDSYDLQNDLTAVSVSRFPDILTVEKKDLDADSISAGIAAVVFEHISVSERAVRNTSGDVRVEYLFGPVC
jgi:uncharacterized protein (TIGR00255 family)